MPPLEDGAYRHGGDDDSEDGQGGEKSRHGSSTGRRGRKGPKGAALKIVPSPAPGRMGVGPNRAKEWIPGPR